jgi:predicted PurR-regulated permease PerM
MSYDLSPATRNQLIFWGGALVLFLLAVHVLGGMLLPFVLGLAIAYLLDPVVERMTRWRVKERHFPRALAALLILSLFVLFIVLAAAVILPVAAREAGQLAEALPGYADKIWELMAPYVTWAQERLGHEQIDGLRATLQNNIGKVLSVSGGVLAGIASGGQAMAGFVTTAALTPIVAYYMMKEWPVMKRWFDGLLPRKHYDTIHELWREIDAKISGFVRGQITVAFVLAVIYAVALSIAGLKFGFLIGFMAGALSIIPMVGSTLGLVVSVAVAWFQSGTWEYTAVIAAIFLVGQFVEGNFLTPKLLGDSVGLHPLWILFALLAGGALFGIVGMLLAVPVVATIGVLANFAIRLYKNSAYYNAPADTQKKKKADRAE